jgi:hypothetical protein
LNECNAEDDISEDEKRGLVYLIITYCSGTGKGPVKQHCKICCSVFWFSLTTNAKVMVNGLYGTDHPAVIIEI